MVNDVDEEAGGAVTATDAMNDRSSQACNAPRPNYAPSEAERRQNALYIAQNSVRGHTVSAEELIKRAKEFYAYLEGTTE